MFASPVRLRRIAARIVFVVVFAALASSTPAFAAGNQRPLSDWLSQQGTTSVFFPPVPDLLGWANGDDPPLQPPRFALVDYAGVFNAYIQQNSGPDLGTTVSGTVTERPLSDGRASVHVNIHTTNALTWVTDISASFPGPTIFGSSPSDVVSGATAALGECDLDLIFINSKPGAPLPNLVEAIGNLGLPPAGVEVVFLRFTARATGALHAAFGVPEGTLGEFLTSQTGFDVTACTLGDPSKQVGPPDTADCFAVETMSIEVLRR